LAATTRIALVRRIFHDAGPGASYTVSEVVQRLVGHGHDFGRAATSDATRVGLTTPMLDKLVANNELAVDTTDGQLRWALPRSTPAVRPSTIAAAEQQQAANTAPKQTSATAARVQAGNVTPSAIRLVVLLETLALILLICAVWPQ
jgi:hypothetical protein